MEIEEAIKTETALKVEEEQMEGYYESLKMALKASVEDLNEEEEKDIDSKIEKEFIEEKEALDKEAIKMKEEARLLKAKALEKQKLEEEEQNKNNKKKLLYMKALQNMDENFEELEDFDDFNEDELIQMKDIINKKRQMKQKQGKLPPDSRKYSRDFIGMNSAPMYNNIVENAHKVLVEIEKSLDEDCSEEASILDRLSTLSKEFEEESKNARMFNEGRTRSMFQQLSEFFKKDNNGGKITQYELYKSKIVHSLKSFLSLPIVEEEFKDSDKNKDNKGFKNTDEYYTILSRYLCFVDVF